MISCNSCGQVCKTTQGLAGHVRLKHQTLENFVSGDLETVIAQLENPVAEVPAAVAGLTIEEFRTIVREELRRWAIEVWRIPASTLQKSSFHSPALAVSTRHNHR